MPRYSVFTPTHDPRRLWEAYDSLLEQTDQDWEWVIVENNGADVGSLPDPRVKVLHYDHANIGALKAFACANASGEWLVELDHDDLLMPDCLASIGACRDADFAYTNVVRVDGEGKPLPFSGDGWESRPVAVGSQHLLEVVSPKPWPSNFSRIWYAPDHVRAWRRDFYERIGGHNPEMHVGDDHDLVARSLLHGRVEHIDRAGYIYRVHGDNSWLANQQEIDDVQWNNHERYFIPLAEQWAEREGLSKLDLGGAIEPAEGYVTVDRHKADVVCDLEERWPFDDQSVGVLRAHDIIEHLRDPIHTMNEAWRVLAHGGVFDILVPSTDGRGAWCDPTHVSFWNSRSFRYYTEAGMRQYLEPECCCRFQIVQLADLGMWEGIPYVKAQLLAIHDGPRIHGPLHF